MSLKDKYQVTNVFVSAVTPENISRQQLLAWVNDSLQSNLTKIEEMSTGAAYCMLTDRLFPGSIPLRKVKWNSKSDVDYLSNWKIVQNAWHDLGITKPIQVQTLMKGKFQDNFEFLQWFKRFYDHNDANYEYDPLEARNHEPFPTSTGIRSSKAPPARIPIAPSTTAARRTTMAPTSNKPVAPVSVTRKSMAPRPATTVTNNTKSNLTVQQEAKYRAEISDLKEQISTWEKTLSSVEQERDYYYAKLHKLELLCNESDAEQEIKVSRILSILYKEEDDGTDLQDFEATEEKILHDEAAPNVVEEDQEHKDILDSTFVKHTEVESNGDTVEEKTQKEDQLIDLDDAQEKETDLNGTFVKDKQPDVEQNGKEEF